MKGRKITAFDSYRQYSGLPLLTVSFFLPTLTLIIYINSHIFSHKRIYMVPWLIQALDWVIRHPMAQIHALYGHWESAHYYMHFSSEKTEIQANNSLKVLPVWINITLQIWKRKSRSSLNSYVERRLCFKY